MRLRLLHSRVAEEICRGQQRASQALAHQVQSAHAGVRFDEAPVDFDEQESDWFKANVELMISRLKDDERAERGLPITPAVDTGGSRTSARGGVIAQARAGKAAAGDVAAAKATRAGALRARTYAEGGTCRCTRAHIH